ncbi:MAG: hypothetical protein M1814_006899 [Vezdaea aestivalis]|nr:MAG: hypothetical protein M1814_006899 [Vezdaea aestivalis]
MPPTDCENYTYEELPPAVRRKFFSTLEQLRFAQEAAALQSNPIIPNKKFNLSTSRLSRPRTSACSGTDAGRRPGTSHTTSRRLRKSHTGKDDFLQAQSDATWFLGLPDKVRRGQFSREEQVLYSGRCESIILDAADEKLYNIGRRNSQSSMPVPSPTADRTSWLADTEDNENQLLNLGEEVEDCFRYKGEDHGLDQRLQLDDYHQSVIETAPSSTTDRWKKAAFRRTLSLTSNPFARGTGPTDSPPSHSFEKPPSHRRKSSKSFSTGISKHMNKNSITTIDPEATYYQNPEARLKLRVYLASPQKFDEAIEFGFPSTETGTASRDIGPQRPRSSTTHKRSADADTSTFLRDGDRSSLFEDSSYEQDQDETLEEDDEDTFSLSDASAPITPHSLDMAFRHPHRLPGTSSKSTSTDSAAQHLNLAPTLRKPGDTYVHSFAGSREMTLRMTLTRPDLRADESQIYGWQNTPRKDGSKDDPLAMEALPTMVETQDEPGVMRGPFDGPDGWGPVQKENGGFKKLWKKVCGS